MAAVIRSAPNTSMPWARPAPSFSSISSAPATIVAIPIGTLTKKIQCQFTSWVSAPPADEAARTTREQKEAAKRDQVTVHDPGQGRLVQVEVTLHRRQRDVHDRGVENDHELPEADDDQGRPAPKIQTHKTPPE